MGIMIVFMMLLMTPLLYKRYVPVAGAKKISAMDEECDAVFVDVRDFHEAKNFPISSAVHIPLPYLARQHTDIPKKEVVVVVSDRILRNLSIRQLKKYGYDVKGYWCIHNEHPCMNAPA
ncbi:rhodanese-like domain-containing protein [Bacillus songklensis]|uniref:Rhodanese-like domain-containing protein n=1 Tax=Bacillus songklensis TaxID=1069116 RepID=A0ABV8BA19_9BACI